jgi:hypothetical protein
MPDACASKFIDPYATGGMLAVDEYCLAAQVVITKTIIPMQLVVHEDFDTFVKSRALIEGSVIRQYNWHAEDGNIRGISCKLKSADPDGLCQDMNRQVYKNLQKLVDDPVYDLVVFDSNETVSKDEQPGMTGPDWLAPFEMTYLDEAGNLHIATKGFTVDFTDERFLKAPPRFRGVHYCHLVAPEYLAGLMRGTADAGMSVGRVVDTSGPNPALSE